MQTINVRFLQKTVIKVSGATILALASLFIVNIGDAQASTVWGTGSTIDTLEIKQTGNCCSGPDNYRFWTHYYPDVPPTLSFDKIAFQASTTESTLKVYVYVYEDTGGDLRTITDGYSSATPWSGDVNISSVGPLTATKVGDVFTATLPSATTVGTGRYLQLLFTQTGSIASTTLSLSDGIGMFRTVSGGTPAPYEYQTERVKIELCSGSCDSSFGQFSPISLNQLNGTYETKFTSATLSASGTLSAVVNYYIDTDDFVGQYDRPDVVLINISNSDTTQFEQKQKLILPLSTGNASTTINFDTTIPDGEYSAQINFWNMFSQNFVLNRTYLTINFTVSGGVVSVQNVVDSSDAIFPFSQTAYEECGFTNLSGCLNNSMRFLFYPSTESITAVSSQYQALQTKIPFVYVSQASALLTGLYGGTVSTIPSITVTTGIGNLTLISEAQVAAIPYVSLLRSLIAAGLWIMLFTIIYRKTLKIHDNVTV